MGGLSEPQRAGIMADFARGRQQLIMYFRVKLSPTSGFQRHGGDDFAELTLSGTVLADEGRTGAGLSKFVEMAMI